jgi:uncharacterized protein (DUF4415 family)
MSSEREKELAALTAMSEEAIDLEGSPEVREWTAAERGRFFRPRKKQISIRMDMDLLHWFRAQPGPYQTRINEACREYMRRRRQGGQEQPP